MKKKKDLKINKKRVTFISLATLFVVALCFLIIFYIYPQVNNSVRHKQITSIFNSLHLNDSYILQKQSIFGEKRVYEWDKDRTYSSSQEYLHGADVDVTTNELKKAIIDAGFAFYLEPYPGSAYRELIFKSKKGEYVRLTVSGKIRDDHIQNKILMHLKLTDADFMDPNAGPSNVTIKVNLDDNNE